MEGRWLVLARAPTDPSLLTADLSVSFPHRRMEEGGEDHLSFLLIGPPHNIATITPKTLNQLPALEINV